MRHTVRGTLPRVALKQPTAWMDGESLQRTESAAASPGHAWTCPIPSSFFPFFFPSSFIHSFIPSFLLFLPSLLSFIFFLARTFRRTVRLTSTTARAGACAALATTRRRCCPAAVRPGSSRCRPPTTACTSCRTTLTCSAPRPRAWTRPP